jgi:SAM-dependent methyltransferase
VITPPQRSAAPWPVWDEERTAWWLSIADHREAELVPVSDALFAAAHLRSGERVLDVGCGPGTTTRRAHELVGPDGRATGTDVSVGMIDAARRAAGDQDIDWVVGDAQTTDFGTGRYDVVISRFGVMFFADPAAAFANLSRACAPDGRLTLAVWRERDDAPMFAVPWAAGEAVLLERGLPVPERPEGPGPTALGDLDRTTALLHDAGWRDVVGVAPDVPLHIGGGLGVDDAVRMTLAGGPTARLLAGQPDDVVEQIRDRLVTTYQERWDGTGVLVRGGFWVITARPGA